MSQLAVSPARAKERRLIQALKAAWSLSPEDATAELRDPRTGRRHTYPQDQFLHQAQLARLREQARQRLVVPNVCLSLPLSGFRLAPAPVKYQAC